MEDLRLTFLVFGVIAIVAILLHGMWSIRKSAKNKSSNKTRNEASSKQKPLYRFDEDENDDEALNDLGLGAVKIIDEPMVPRKASAVSHEVHDNASPSVAFNTEPKQVKAEANEAINDGASTEASEQENTDLMHSTNNDDLALSASDMDFSLAAQAPEHEQPVKGPVYAGVVTQPKPERAGRVEATPIRDMPEPPSFLLKANNTNEQSTNTDMDHYTDTTKPQLAEAEQAIPATPDAEPAVQGSQNSQKTPTPITQSFTSTPTPVVNDVEAETIEEKPVSGLRRLVSRRKKSVADRIRKEPVIKADDPSKEQMRIDFEGENIRIDEHDTLADSGNSRQNSPSFSAGSLADQNTSSDASSNTSTSSRESSSASKESAEQPMDVLVLNVRTTDDQPINGAALLPMLLTLGFKFGEQDIFHRHVNTNGKGPVLFSLANMVKPGTFDIDQIETFTTPGLSLFMMLPIEGEPQQVFNMMHNAARKLAEEFGCQILDGRRSVLTKQGLQQYSERIRDFERKRINR